ncbi:MAG TPA: hypothetical protein IAA30_01930 [Candidatus Treponema faecavium]|nr:hypothetical protein [Candidatus Treponema faecavium]
MHNSRETREFFQYVIPSVFAFALSGVYAIVDGFFVGNSLGDAGLSAVNIAYPITALIQAAGTGIGMGGAVCYAVNMAEKKEKEAGIYMAGALWLMIGASIVLTACFFFLRVPVLRLLGAEGETLVLAEEYTAVIALGTGLQVIGTGLVPFIRNLGGSVYAMIAMASGFIANIVLDYAFVWVWNQGAAGAAAATVISQGVTLLIALFFLLRNKTLALAVSAAQFAAAAALIIKIGIAPFGLAMTPNISLAVINRFSAFYGGETAIAVYACIAYMISIVYLVFQGVGDGSQPLISRYYGERDFARMKTARSKAYKFALFLAAAACLVLYVLRKDIGLLFGASSEVNAEIAEIMPIFLAAVPFVAVARITTASFYAAKKSSLSYVLTFIEPVLMLVCMLVLPPLFGGQVMIWWSSVIAQIASAAAALMLKRRADRRDMI